MSKKTVLSNIVVYSITHALIDATCAATLFAIVTLERYNIQYITYAIIFYNVLAFATQALFGLVVDKFKVPVPTAVLGTVLVATSTLFLQNPFLAALIAGFGNALFHVGGGVISLHLASGKAMLPGLYVAPGAMGLMIGTLIGKSGDFIAWPFIVLLMGAVLLIVKLPIPERITLHKLSGNLKWFEVVILLLLFSIAIRGIVGLSLVLPWKAKTPLLIMLTSAVVLGKALGGILGDRVGWNKVALTGLVVAAPLLTLFNHNPWLTTIGAFFFNLTMPITLTCLAEMLPGHSGFTFGLTTLALIIGAGPTFTRLRDVTRHPTFIFPAILVSIVALYGGMKLYTKHFIKNVGVSQAP